MQAYEDYRVMVEEALLPQLHRLSPIPQELDKAMAYSLSAGGKRLRPVLLLASCDLLCGDTQAALPFACALEMIHTYSLIHDDLPAMDNDDLRRGKPTNHKVFGEALAILAGDGLLSAAVELMALEAASRAENRYVKAMLDILHGAGVSGMVAGQTKDVLLEGTPPTEETVSYIHTHKTADLLTAPIKAGLRLAGADEQQLCLGEAYGRALGIAFQIQDDLLDLEGDPALLGKNVGMDATLDKQTWVALKGAEQARQDAEKWVQEAINAIKGLGKDVDFFTELAQSTMQRKQ